MVNSAVIKADLCTACRISLKHACRQWEKDVVDTEPTHSEASHLSIIKMNIFF